MTEPLNFIYGFGVRAHMRQVNAAERIKALHRMYEREVLRSIIKRWSVKIDLLFSNSNYKFTIWSSRFHEGDMKAVLGVDRAVPSAFGTSPKLQDQERNLEEERS